MKILSLFDGMACGMIAMKNAGVDVEEYNAYEIDKYAIKVATHNFPEIIENGDVFDGDFEEYDNVDFLIFGSPCTRWSISQSPAKRETTASGVGWDLFSQGVKALKQSKPKMFIYENNKSMSDAIRNSITETFGFEPICINSALVSAQNRNRLYWVGIRNEDGTYRTANVNQPEDKGVILKDILDSGEDLTSRQKDFCLDATYAKVGMYQPLVKHRRSMVAEPVCVASRGRYNEDGSTYQHYEVRGEKTNTLTTVGKDNMVMQPIRVWTLPREDGVQTQGQAFRVYSTDGKGVSLKAGAGGSGGKTGLYAVESEINMKDVYEVRDGMITANGRTYPIKIKDGFYRIRKLSVDECKRLQTVPEWYDFSVISNTQAYKCLGNGWTCDVITHIIKSCLKDWNEHEGSTES